MSAAPSLLLRRAASSAARSLPSSSSSSASRRTFAAAAAASSSEDLVKTSLNDLHRSLGGEMVPFAGYELPVLYKGIDEGGVMKEHLWCRADGKASLFDVSHMGQIRWHGSDRSAFLESVVVGDIAGLSPGSGLLSLVTNDDGGIIDDTVITQYGNYTYMVVNGATKHGDMEHFAKMMERFGGDVEMEYLGDEVQLLALQGPGAAEAAAKVLPDGFDLTGMAFMTGTETTLDGIEGCRITRCGYTGEDGFELAVPASSAESLAAKLLEDPIVNPAGLGARDSLRLEAGLCLYGNDIDSTTTPTEAALGWTMGGKGSRRRTEGGFPGAEKVLTSDGKFRKSTRKRVGIRGMKAPARGGVDVYDAEGETKVGTITSGTYSPCLKAPIAMGYVDPAHAKAGTEITVEVRGKKQKAQVTKMPFVESRYYRVPE